MRQRLRAPYDYGNNRKSMWPAWVILLTRALLPIIILVQLPTIASQAMQIALFLFAVINILAIIGWLLPEVWVISRKGLTIIEVICGLLAISWLIARWLGFQR
jgi:hypothetical protein